MIASILSSISLCIYSNIKALNLSSPIELRQTFLMHLKEELALSTPLDVTEVNSSSLMIVVIFGNIVRDAFYSHGN